jgi:hypothetical protein
MLFVFFQLYVLDNYCLQLIYLIILFTFDKDETQTAQKTNIKFRLVWE